jgi:hypothetical protein
MLFDGTETTTSNVMKKYGELFAGYQMNTGRADSRRPFGAPPRPHGDKF